MKEDIKKLLNKAIFQVKKTQEWPDFDMPEIDVDYVKNEQFGDYSSNIAMILAGKIGKNPMEVAEQIVEQMGVQLPRRELNSQVKVEIAAPGYINFYLSEKYLQNVALKINSEKNDFGNSKIGKGIKVNNEFISANPTGPLHLGNGRGGFYGDCLSKVLRKVGFDVTNEYFVNDAGEQVLKLGHSVLKDSGAVYAGEYIDELNKKYVLNQGPSLAPERTVLAREVPSLVPERTVLAREVGAKAAEDILENIIRKTVKEKMQINFDEWISEKKLQDEKYVDRAIDLLQEKKLTYESGGAFWLKTTEFGDDKDRVLIKKDKNKTYFATDCGYILNKKERGFDKIIEIWGADHHGYINRFQAAAEALGFQKEQTKFIIVQLVRLVKDGKEARMSKRAGNVVYIDDLISEIGHDVTRFFFLMYSPDTHMNFDLGLAKERSQKNPVFYVQYAHARIRSILNKAEDLGVQLPKGELNSLNLLTHEKELSLIKELNKFPELVEEISENYEVHKLPQYAIKLADKFHSFYDACRVIDEENQELTESRLLLANAVRIVLAETLNLIGVSAPEKM